MNKDWTEILKESMAQDNAVLPEDDFALLQSRYGAYRRRKVLVRWSAATLSAAALLAALIVLPRFYRFALDAPVSGIPASGIPASEIKGAGEFIVQTADDAVVDRADETAVDIEVTGNPAEVTMQAAESMLLAEVMPAAEAEQPEQTIEASSPEVAAAAKAADPEGYTETVDLLEDIAPVHVDIRRKSSPRLSLAAGGGIAGSKGGGAFAPSFNAPAVYPMMLRASGSDFPMNVSDDAPVSYSHVPVPVEVTLSCRAIFLEHLSVTSGLKYTLLMSNCGMPDGTFKIQNVNYLGIPLTVDYLGHIGRGFSFYAGGGVLAEKCIYATRGDKRLSERGLQCALELNAGVQYDFNSLVGIFVEPELNYYVTKSELVTLRSSTPWRFAVNIGLRFNINRL